MVKKPGPKRRGRAKKVERDTDASMIGLIMHENKVTLRQAIKGASAVMKSIKKAVRKKTRPPTCEATMKIAKKASGATK